MAKQTKKLKTGKPRKSDLHDVTLDFSATAESLEALGHITSLSVVEIGRQLAKQYRNREDLMAATRLATDLEQGVAAARSLSGYCSGGSLAEQLGYDGNQVWTETDKCGNTVRADIDDLFERGLEVTVAVQIRRKLRPAAELAKYGIK